MNAHRSLLMALAALTASLLLPAAAPARPLGLSALGARLLQVEKRHTTPRRVLRARLLPSGLASVPTGAPRRVQQAVRAANRIVGMPYIYGGGHGSFQAAGYDCSGTVSYALHGGRLLQSPMASGPLTGWGRPGRGRWITVYANAGHAFVHIAGLRLDTSAAEDPGGGKGPRWRRVLRATAGYVARHPEGL